MQYFTGFSISQSADVVEVTAYGDTSKTYVAGLPDASGSLDGLVDLGTTAFSYIIGSATARKMYLYPDATNNSGTYFFCTAYFSGDYSGSNTDAIKVSVNWNAATPGAWVSGP
jgi:hypothetical protein